MTFPFTRLTVAFVLALAPGLAAAHDLWFTFEPVGAQERAAVNFGHPDDRVLPSNEKLLEVQLVTATGTTALWTKKMEEGRGHGAPVLMTRAFPVPPADSIMIGRYDNGFFVRTPEGSHNASKRMFPNGDHSVWAPKYAKTLLGPGAWRRSAGHDLELAPLEDPFTLPAGRPLHVRVLFHGQPLAGADVELGDGLAVTREGDLPKFRADAGGVAAVPMTRRGGYLITIDHRIPGAYPVLAEQDYYSASLSFTLP